MGGIVRTATGCGWKTSNFLAERWAEHQLPAGWATWITGLPAATAGNFCRQALPQALGRGTDPDRLTAPGLVLSHSCRNSQVDFGSMTPGKLGHRVADTLSGQFPR